MQILKPHLGYNRAHYPVVGEVHPGKERLRLRPRIVLLGLVVLVDGCGPLNVPKLPLPGRRIRLVIDLLFRLGVGRVGVVPLTPPHLFPAAGITALSAEGPSSYL